MTTPISILLLGDSLTEGWSYIGTIYHPYGTQLKKRSEEAGVNFEIKIEGFSGDRVTKNTSRNFLNRLQRAIKEKTDEEKKFDYVVILGGINDCADGTDANKIFEGLKKLYDICEDHGATVFALTLLEFIYDKSYHDLEERRKKVNELIRNYSTTNNKIVLYDLSEEFPVNSISKDQRKLYWCDSVHLTPEGYDRMGDLIFEALYNQITK